MDKIYTKPLSVYIILGALGLWGIWCGIKLPISLFPNSSQITISINIPTGPLSSLQFFEAYGKELEATLAAMKIENIGVKELKANYRNKNTNYQLTFLWGADPDQTILEVRSLVNNHFSGSSEEIRRGISVHSWNENRGFFAVSFYSPMRSLDDLYQTLEPMITPIKSKIEDAGEFGLWNPNQKEISVHLNLLKMAQYQVTSIQIQRAIQDGLVGLTGGTLRMGEKDYLINLPKNVDQLDFLSRLRLRSSAQAPILLKDLATISLGVSKENRQKFKTSGIESLILFASPKEGGNVKRMSDQILDQLNILKKEWPKDVEFKILVNPSEFINNSVKSVIHEVFLAAFLAVVVLFLFLGSFKNVVTAAIEIPLSLLLAFILMRLTNMNLNLISLGGLALSAGMNVDASVVVLENIVRHFKNNLVEKMSYQEKVNLIGVAVSEVRLPIIASTLASLVVFFPLIFTQGLTHSLLGDLAKAVIFSHGLSALVALVLVPTIRLQIFKNGNQLEAHSPIEPLILKCENLYRCSLTYFINNRKWQKLVLFILVLILPLLIYLVLPRLDKEVIGKPDSDWLIIGVSSSAFANNKQMESEIESLEMSIDQHFGNEKLYTFTQIFGSHDGNVMIRMKNKNDMSKAIEKAEELYKNTANKSYWVESWNPSELSIPDPPQFRLEIVGGEENQRLNTAQDIQNLLLENGIFDKVRVIPTSEKEKEIRILALNNSGSESEVISKDGLSHFLRMVTEGVYAERIFQNQQELPIYLRSSHGDVTTLDQLKALPFGFEGKLIPLGALAHMTIENRQPSIYREDQKSLMVVTARLNKNQMHKIKEKEMEASKIIKTYKDKIDLKNPHHSNLIQVSPAKELDESLNQLKWAVAISIFLVFITMVIQLGDLVHSLLVLIAIPLGFIGVLISLFVFKSTLSLNSGLGTILLNGIAVANSIILVDFIRKLHLAGKDAHAATIEASVARLRPIFMTSLTTVLGMLPIALGWGEGGKILQPLGIAVCGGLWVSMSLTLYIVPTLQYLYLSSKEKK